MGHPEKSLGGVNNEKNGNIKSITDTTQIGSSVGEKSVKYMTSVVEGVEIYEKDSKSKPNICLDTEGERIQRHKEINSYKKGFDCDIECRNSFKHYMKKHNFQISQFKNDLNLGNNIELQHKLIQRTVNILYLKGLEGGISMQSGVIFDGKTLFTNKHGIAQYFPESGVVTGDFANKIFIHDHKGNLLEIESVHMDPEKDIAVIKFTQNEDTALFTPLSTTDFPLGEDLISAGFRGDSKGKSVPELIGFSIDIFDGDSYLKHIGNSDLDEIIVLDGFLEPGDSGGPVFGSDTGDLFAINSGIVCGTNQSEFIPIAHYLHLNSTIAE